MTRRSIGLAPRFGRRWRRGAVATALLLLGACAPRTAPRPTPQPAPRPNPAAPGLPTREPPVRVGLVVDTTSVELSAPGGLELLASEGGNVLQRVGPGERVVIGADAGGRVEIRGAGAGAARATGSPLVIARPAGEGTITIAGKPYRGAAMIRATGPGRVTAINRVDMEAYLLGVVPREIGRVGEERFQAAKAQAVAARTYAFKYLGRREQLGFDVFATVQDQVYGGVEGEYELVSRAVRETAGEILTYEGAPIEAYYHSTCAGQTAGIHEVWKESPIPYLRSVVDVDPRTGEAYDRISNRFRWTQRWPVDTLESILSRTLADSLPAGTRSVGQLRDLQVLERTVSGRVKALRISTTAGNFVVGGDRVRWILATPSGAILNSSKFDIHLFRDAQGRPSEVVALGGGWGHGIGMCQVGAMGRAEAGQDYRTILDAYYPGARLQDLY